MSILTVTAAPVKTLQQKHFDVGYALYVAHQPLDACQSDAQRRGWMAALYANAEAETPGYAAKRGF